MDISSVYSTLLMKENLINTIIKSCHAGSMNETDKKHSKHLKTQLNVILLIFQ